MSSDRCAVAIVAYLGDDGLGWLPTLVSLREADPELDVVVAAAPDCHDLGTIVPDVTSTGLAALLTMAVVDDQIDWVVVAGEPCLLPIGVLDRLDLYADSRTASVSFLCNAAGPLSFPFAGTPVPWALGGGSPTVLTHRLRNVPPQPALTPGPTAAGPLIAFSSAVIRMFPSTWDAGCTSWNEAVATFASLAQARGLINMVDPATYVHRAADLRAIEELSGAQTDRLSRRFPSRAESIDMAIADTNTQLQLEYRVARSKVSGLDVLLDGSCLGPLEMGTQVGLISIAHALAQRQDVASIGITLRGALPGYARKLGEESKVRFVRCDDQGNLEVPHTFDVFFRPFQPDIDFDPAIARKSAHRVIVSILDLIAYQNGSYFPSPYAWQSYRSSIIDALRRVDAVTTISHDVASMIGLERLPIAADRVFPVVYGTGHVDEFAARTMPEELASHPGLRFLVCLGTNYGHKNRDVAVRALRLLRDRGHDVSLVLAGPTVPVGSSRLLEATALAELPSTAIVTLTDVTTSERNWLLAHAEIVLYPTSAEGFGLVPYEAAWLGTPTVFVPFGPLAEIAGEKLPLTVRDWSPRSFADAVEAHLQDPSVGAGQVRALRSASARNSWNATAASLCAAIREVMSKAPVA